MKRVFKQQDLQMFSLKIKSMSHFRPIEVVGRGSETQLQWGENSNLIC